MSTPAGKPATDVEYWLGEARAGSSEGVQRTLALCQAYLLEMATVEFGAEARALAREAFLEVERLLAGFSGRSEADLRDWLRRILLDQTRTHTPGTLSTYDHASASTPKPRGGAPSDEACGDGVALPKIEGYEIADEIARGGMGIVYRAWQPRLQRWVAIKCLPPAFADDAERLQRFRHEAELAAKVTEHGVLQIYDIIESGSAPALVLPFIDGSDLARIIAQRRGLKNGGQTVQQPHPWAALDARGYVARLLPFFDKVLDALVLLHQAGVLHRDLKPSNILVDQNGNGWLTDFGLAHFGQLQSLTQPGQGLGTPGFMSPEQWDGAEDVDAGTDVFGIGVTLYQTLTLTLPYGKSLITAATPPARLPRDCRHALPPNLDLVLEKAIHPDRRRRYRSAVEMRDDWQRVRKGLLPNNVRVGLGRRSARQARHGAATIAVAIVAVAVLFAVLFQPRGTTAMRKVRVETEPPGASIVLVPINAADGTLEADKAIRPKEKSPTTVQDVPVGDYLVVVVIDEHRFQEVYRTVPTPGTVPSLPYDRWHEESDGSIAFGKIAILGPEVTKDMAYIAGGEFDMGFPPLGYPTHRRQVPSFFLDLTEVTVDAYRQKMESLPVELTEKPLSPTCAVTWVSFRDALLYAESVGKRLPDEAEYEYAATNGGTTVFPWGDDATLLKSWPMGPVKEPAFDQSKAKVFGLYSNVAEWTSSWLTPFPNTPDAVRAIWPEKDHLRQFRVIRGAPRTVVLGGPIDEKLEPLSPRFRKPFNKDDGARGLGFRCARGGKPRFF
jgi:serine/threonine-protein kinase